MIRLAALLLWLAGPAFSDGPGPAVGVTGAAAKVTWGGATLRLDLGGPVAWRVAAEGDPPRLVLDTAEVDWSGLDPEALAVLGEAVSGRVGPGWSRLAVALPEAMRIERAWMTTRPGTSIHVELRDGAPAAAPPPAAWSAAPAPVPADARPRQDGVRPLVIALDPGHGGIDPGAERAGATEAALMLRFAGELAEVLRRAGHVVVLTRADDAFVGLRGRIAIARAAGADLMLSLHADAIGGGDAEGATVYTLSAGAGDALSEEIARRHGQDDLLLGVTLEQPGDEIAGILMDLARIETAPRSARLARTLVSALGEADLGLHKRPRLGGRFTVLKAPDIPSVLLELGFMSDPEDLSNLLSADWRGRMAAAIGRAVAAWRTEDAAEVHRLRR